MYRDRKAEGELTDTTVRPVWSEEGQEKGTNPQALVPASKELEPAPKELEPASKKLDETKPAGPVEAPRAVPAVPVVPAIASNDTAAAQPQKKMTRKVILAAALVAALSVGGWYGNYWWTAGRYLVSTDDAYVGAK